VVPAQSLAVARILIRCGWLTRPGAPPGPGVPGPPENAKVRCVDGKSQIQALDQTTQILPMVPGKVERRSHDYYRHRSTTLFATLDMATGPVTAAL